VRPPVCLTRPVPGCLCGPVSEPPRWGSGSLPIARCVGTNLSPPQTGPAPLSPRVVRDLGRRPLSASPRGHVQCVPRLVTFQSGQKPLLLQMCQAQQRQIKTPPRQDEVIQVRPPRRTKDIWPRLPSARSGRQGTRPRPELAQTRSASHPVGSAQRTHPVGPRGRSPNAAGPARLGSR
jgi:hypothetical protein